MKTKEALTKFFNNHYPELKDAEIKSVHLYDSNPTDLVLNRPGEHPTLFDDETADPDEYDGVILEISSKEAIPIKHLANLCNILCFGIPWLVLPDYGGCDIKEFKDYLQGELDTCWHHSQITKVSDSNGYYYTIEQGLCLCS